jgi:hypothetical protein
MCIPNIVARQRLGKNFIAAMNTQATRNILSEDILGPSRNSNRVHPEYVSTVTLYCKVIVRYS